jgi:hypothetical protein
LKERWVGVELLLRWGIVDKGEKSEWVL